MTREKLAKELYPELTDAWIAWLLKDSQNSHPFKILLNKVDKLLKEKK